MSYKSVPQECPTRVSHKSVPQECPIRVSHKSVLQECPTRVSYKSGPQECATRVSHRVSRKSVLQECPLDILVFRSCLHSGSWVPSCFFVHIFHKYSCCGTHTHVYIYTYRVCIYICTYSILQHHTAVIYRSIYLDIMIYLSRLKGKAHRQQTLFASCFSHHGPRYGREDLMCRPPSHLSLNEEV